MIWSLRTSAEASCGTPTGVQRVFRPAVTKCQSADDTFPTITPHDLRHTAASLAVSVGANMTLDTYADLFDEDLDDVADRLNAAIQTTADALRTASEA